MKIFRDGPAVFAAFVLLVFLAVSCPAAPRDTISLDGTWSFATDPEQIGERDRWFEPGRALPPMPREGYAKTADGTIRVPGCWDPQGYGTETNRAKHNFIGKGWYKKTVPIPGDWKGRSVFLSITGMTRYAKVWIDGSSAGEEAIGCVSVHEWDVSKLLKPGKEAEITICIDSKQRCEIDALTGCSLLNVMVDSSGGIWGHVRLEARPNIRLDDPYIRTKIQDGVCRAEFSIIDETGRRGDETVALEIFEYRDGGPVGDPVAKTTAKPDRTGGRSVVEARVPGARLWSPESPNLYIARLTLLQGDRPVDEIQIRFGIREFRIEGGRLLLNDRPLFLRGYGDDHVYTREWSLPADKKVHLERLRLIRSFGFNYVRHHSTMMPPEYYEACDELGIMPMGEFLIRYQMFMPGEKAWREKVPEGTSPEAAIRTYLERWEAVVKQYRHHPSILCWVMGNELWDDNPGLTRMRTAFRDIAKRHDPDRFFLDSAGTWKRTILDPKNDRDTIDFYCCLFDEWSSPILNPGKFDFPDPPKPIVSHESGNYITFTRPDTIERFADSNFKPSWMFSGRQKLEQLGLRNEADDWALATEKLYLLHHKYNIELLRKNPNLSGYQWWLFQDYWMTSNGLADTTFRLKSIAPEDVLPFNSAVVLLQDGLETTYRSGDDFAVNLLVSNCSPYELSGRVSWRLDAENQTVAQGTENVSGTVPGALHAVGRMTATLPETSAPVEMKLRVSMSSSTINVPENFWTARLFPKTIVPETGKTSVYIDEETTDKTPAWDIPAIPATQPLPSDAVYVVSTLNPEILDALDRGAAVVLPSRLTTTPAIALKYQSTWWLGGGSDKDNHTGTYVYDHPVVRDMAPGHWGDIAWAHLLEGAEKHLLDSAPCRPEILVRALPSLRRVQDSAVLYKVGVGRGTLFVSGLNHFNGKDRPENAWLLKKLIEDAARFEPPTARWPKEFCKSEPPLEVPEGMVHGFRSLGAIRPNPGSWISYRSKTDKNTIRCMSAGRHGRARAWNGTRTSCRVIFPVIP